jgi:predicted ATPase
VTAVVGRDRELAEIISFLDLADADPRVLLLEGDAGIGKTTLWRAGVEAAREQGYRVLACAGAAAETKLSFTALRDLVGDPFEDVAGELPPPQRHAIEIVLFRAEATGVPPTPDTIAVAFLSTLRALAGRRPTLLAVVGELEMPDLGGDHRLRARRQRRVANGQHFVEAKSRAFCSWL